MKLKRFFIISIVLLACIVGLGTTRAAAQEVEPVSEQTVAADPAVTVLLCLESGGITVRGWDKKEVRARNASDGQIELRRPDATPGTPASRIEVASFPSPDQRPRPGECNGSADIVLDVPRGSTVQLKGRSGDMDVTGIANLRADTQSGSIELRDISNLVEATTANGDISLTRATVRARLRTISGSIVVSNAGPEGPGDDLWLNTTSGDITLDQVRHARVEAKTAAGSIHLSGALARGGLYDLQSYNGDVTLSLPADSSFFVNAKVYHGGDIVTEFPVRLTSPAAGCQNCPAPTPDNDKHNKSKPPKPQGNVILTGGNLTGVCGQNEKGDATLTLASFSGSVRLRKSSDK